MSVSDRYSLSRRDKKLAGVCSTIGEVFNIDPTFVRVGFAAFAILISWKLALITYVAAGIYLHMQRNQVMRRRDRPSEFERMADLGRSRTSVHDMRTKLDVNDRRMMAVDHHLNSQNDELAREIEALREEK